jgi:uncharacterized protein YprB with RNaseH-like and TPR domain
MRKQYSAEEAFDAFALSPEEFLAKHTTRNADSLRLFLSRQTSKGSRVGEYVGFNMAFWDLETSDLKPNFGRIMAGAIADNIGDVEVFRREDYPGASVIDDGELVLAQRDALERYDIIVTWNGLMFDHMFLDARLIKAGHRPLRRDIMRLDLMYQARGINGLGSARLDNVAKFLKCANQKTPLSMEVWAKAIAGDAESYDYIVDHNIADVLVTREVFHKLKHRISGVHR